MNFKRKNDFMEKDFYKRETCRACGGTDLTKFLDLGEMPPANAFLSESELKLPEKKFPLAVYFCRGCSLVQLLDVVNPELLFKNYHYMTSASKPLAEHFRKMAAEIAEKFIETKNDLVVEIGSNDGVLLEAIKSKCRVLGIEPSENLARIAEKNGVPTIEEFFSYSLAEKILQDKGEARIVVANNVMAHIDDMKDIFSGVKKLIGKNGIFVFEVHWLGNLIGAGGFDQIYHEHLCYWSLHSLKKFIEPLGMKIFDVQKVPMHGESIRVFVSASRGEEKSVSVLLSEEKNIGLNKEETFFAFAKRVEKNRQELLDLLKSLKSEGKKIIGYGAPAKGNTLLNYCGLGTETIDCISDSTPFKQGLFAPGSHIPILSPENFKKSPPDFALLLAWNYAEEILKKEQDFREAGGKFILPVPKVKIA